ncbi:MAG: type II toxin-antitoxin system HicA family toxin [Pleurocapsa sp. SU_5_0]|nr:type II toxin-antitoxin system HicA family toxin [Pleurocapsa sp. SU_5_0]NJR44658.1 type II toxin-antitoxin system HicA family toxin [Hyellaceae cyanobacterium CSU_1_1]
MKKKKLLEKILSGSKNIQFDEMVSLVEAFGFRLDRVSGSHHIFKHPDIPDLVNIQNRKGKAQPYQVRQFLAIVEENSLKLKEK